MFSLMANCFTWIKKRREPRKKVTILMVGLDNAGKTSTVASVKGDELEGIIPTVGFMAAKFTFERSEVTMFDIGGGPRIRSIWHNYYSESYGIIYVVDSSDETRIDEGKKVLQELISQPRATGKPLLVLANKRDKEGAMTEHEVDQRLDLAYLSQKHKTPYEVFSCSAVLGTGRKMDKQIKKGLKWLLSTITSDYAALTERVNQDVAIQKEAEAKQRAKVREEIRKRREERERAEAAAAQAAQDKEEESDGVVIGTKKEKKKPASQSDEGERSPEVTRKKKKKKRKKKKRVVESDHEEEDIELKQSIMIERHPPSPTHEKEVEEHRPEVEESNEMEGEELRSKPRRSKHHKKHEIIEDEEENTQDIIESKAGPLRTLSHDDSDQNEDIDHDFRRQENDLKDIDKHIEVDNDYVENTPDDQDSPAPEVKVKKKKKKKKKLKSNKTAPAPEDVNEDEDKLPPLGWGTSGSLVNGFSHGRVPPRLEPLRPPMKSTFDPRGMVESITEQSDDDNPLPRSNWARYRPNSEDQDIVT